MPTTEFIIQWLITWLVLAVVFFVAADQIQRYLYEAPVDRLAWRVMGLTPLLAAVLVKWPLTFDKMLDHVLDMAVQAIVWFLACWLGLRFQWQHAAAAGIIAVMTIAPVASSSVERFAGRTSPPPSPAKAAAKPAVSPASPTAPASPPGSTSNPAPAAGATPAQR